MQMWEPGRPQRRPKDTDHETGHLMSTVLVSAVRNNFKWILMTLGATALVGIGNAQAGACGGFFCQNSPVDQVAERILFTVNPNNTVTSLIEISYVGSAEDFSWILPIPEAIAAEDLAVPEGGSDVFDELHRLTDVQFIAPDHECRTFGDDDFTVAAASAEDGGVEVFASGEVGPFGFDVIGAEDPQALVTWLRDNNYRVTPEMEPLIDIYVEEKFAFVAMRLLDGQDVNAIEPIEITYPGSQAMIPLRLTAVAANPNMPIFVWVFAEDQVVPANYGHMKIDTVELTFNDFGNGTDYTQLVTARADALDGRAFITEFAGPSDSLAFTSSYLRDKAGDNRYLTRLYTTISPHEMTVDPVFEIDAEASNVSNIRDASNLNGLRRCQRDDNVLIRLVAGSDARDPFLKDGTVAAQTPAPSRLNTIRWAGLAVLLGGTVLVARNYKLQRRTD